MKTDNELIAEFMGYVPRTDLHSEGAIMMQRPDSHFAYILNKSDDKHEEFPTLEFDTSWDWLMPVVRKIKELIIDLPPNNEHFQAIVNNLIDVEIWDCHYEVVEFIKWHNQLKLTTQQESPDSSGNSNNLE